MADKDSQLWFDQLDLPDGAAPQAGPDNPVFTPAQRLQIADDAPVCERARGWRRPIRYVPTWDRIRLVLAAIIIPLVMLTVVAMIALWPRGESQVGSQPQFSQEVIAQTARITKVSPAESMEVAPEVRAVLTSGNGEGNEVPISAPNEIVIAGLHVGDDVRVIFIPNLADTGVPYVYVDTMRAVPLLVYAALYVLVVLLVARWKGLAAIIGLVASLAVVMVFMLPSIMGGHDPLLVTLVASSAILLLSVYFAHGISVRTTTAVLGTLVGLIITIILAMIGAKASALSGAVSEDAMMLLTHFPSLSTRALLVAGIVLAGLGALNDVTITQASTVWELRSANPSLGATSLFTRAMRIGRDHIASTVYTLAFAYVGTALPMLIMAMLIDRSLLATLQVEEVAEEVVRTLVASIGLVLAIPITTVIGALLAARVDHVPHQVVAELAGHGHSH